MYRQAHALEAPSAPMPICVRCGVIAPARAHACPMCAEAYPHPRETSPTDGLLWVAVRASFQCRSCHFLSPLDELDIDGSVECAQCTMQQRFDVGAWPEALAFMHGVGDLAYPPPEGRDPNPHIWIGEDNPHIRLGYTDVFAEHRQSSTVVQHGVTMHRSLFVQATPGHPVCTKCARVLRISIKGNRTNARCDDCGEQASHQLPHGAKQLSATLQGVVALAHRMDKPMAQLDTHGGTHTLKCGQCGGDLPVAKDRVVECGYCSATNLVPTRARARDPGRQIQPEIWWLAFEGPSAARRAVEAPAVGGGAMTKYFGGETHLEHAAEKKSLNFKQLLLSLTLPTLALVVGYFIVHAFSLHKIAF